MPPLCNATNAVQARRMKAIDDGMLEQLGHVHNDAGGSEKHSPGTVARLFRTHARRIGRVLARQLRNPDDAADARQDLFLKLWRQEKAGQLKDEATAYMNAAAITIAIDVERRRKSHAADRMSDIPLEDLQHGTASHDEMMHWREGVRALIASLAQLPQLTQQVFLLYHVEGLSHVAIANRLGTSVRSVERHMAQALAHCKQGLKDHL